MLEPDSFDTLARRFAADSAGRTPTWAFLAAEDEKGAFGAAPTGYLRASPLLVPEHASPAKIQQYATISADALLGVAPTGEADDATTLPAAGTAARLELHIVHSATYRVPVLLLQGHHPDGAPWTPDELRAYLVAQQRHPEADGGGRRLAPLSGAVVTQLEHPVLRIPCCCVDPCETAALMAALLERPRDGADGARLDYLSAWWSVLAPLVGAESRSAWYANRTPNPNASERSDARTE